MKKIRVTIWNEFRHERAEEYVRNIYPDGIHGALAKNLAADDLEIRTAWLDQPQNGLPPEVIENTDVLIIWAHMYHDEVVDEVVQNVVRRVQEGMGLIVLHSGHLAKIFRALTGTSCTLKWREFGERERIWNIEPTHPITHGIGEYFELPHEEMYGERFDIPSESKVLFLGWFEGGEVFRSGFTLERGRGKIFYFQPGHEAFASLYDENVLRIIGNAIRWAAPEQFVPFSCPCWEPLERIRTIHPNPKQAASIERFYQEHKEIAK